jgi:hypothetical protein
LAEELVSEPFHHFLCTELIICGSYENENKFAGIIYLYDITRNRIPFIPPKNISLFNDLCGRSDAAKKVILVTTRWHGVQEREGQRREVELSRKYWKQMMQQGSSVVRFEDSRDSAWKIVISIIGKTPPKEPKDQPPRFKRPANPGIPSREFQFKSRKPFKFLAELPTFSRKVSSKEARGDF